MTLGLRAAAAIAALLVGGAVGAEEPAKSALDMDALVITPSRMPQPLRDVPTHASVLDREATRATAAQTVDDLLRRVPGFSLFRRSSSLVAQPTTQGVTLRGIGPSGTSRTLVLLDGVPVNDPFGGWIYWSRLPRETIERIEIIRGGASDVWGNAALGGVLHFVTATPTKRGAHLRASGGNEETYDLEGGAAEVRGPFRLEVGGSVFDTGGYPVVRSGQRGAIDVDADSEHQAFRGRAGYTVQPGLDVTVRGGVFHEERGNGTPFTENETDAGDVAATVDLQTESLGAWRALAYAQLQTFSATFSSAAADRNAETPALDQFDVPSTGVGAGLSWNQTFAEAHRLSAGADFRRVDGDTNEDFRFLEGRFQGRRKAGAEQFLIGAFAADSWSLLPSLVLTAGGRVDVWESSDAFRRERSQSDGSITRDERFDDEDDVAFSPKVGLVYRVNELLSLRSAFYQAFRAPTINEQVRPFRVRNDITEANAALEPERLTGGELGIDFIDVMYAARLTGFWSEIEDPIANVTIGAGGGPVPPCGFVPEGGVCRQRRNLGRSRIRGFEAELAWSPHPWLTLGSSYLFDDAKIIDAEGEIDGKRLAQVPKHTVVNRADVDAGEIGRGSVQVRWVSDSFEDDLNSLELGDFVVVDLSLARTMFPGVDLFFGIENLFDRTIETGRSGDGIVAIGSPLLVHGGVRIEL